jgi:hypothetical protein
VESAGKWPPGCQGVFSIRSYDWMAVKVLDHLDLAVSWTETLPSL